MNAITLRLMPIRALLLASGCATMMNGSRQDITFATTPAGATVMADGAQLCVTPCAANLKRSSDHVVTLNAPGYYPYRLILRHKGSNWVAGNLMFLPLPTELIDLATGSAWYLTPEQVDRALEKQAGEGVSQRDGASDGVQVALAPLLP